MMTDQDIEPGFFPGCPSQIQRTRWSTHLIIAAIARFRFDVALHPPRSDTGSDGHGTTLDQVLMQLQKSAVILICVVARIEFWTSDDSQAQAGFCGNIIKPQRRTECEQIILTRGLLQGSAGYGDIATPFARAKGRTCRHNQCHSGRAQERAIAGLPALEGFQLEAPSWLFSAVLTLAFPVESAWLAVFFPCAARAASRNSRRKILPTLVFGRDSRNSIDRGRL